MNTQKIFGLCMLMLLALLPLSTAAVQPTFEQKVDTALDHAQAVIDIQATIKSQFPVAGGQGQINENLLNMYRFGLSVYENDVNSIPEVIQTQNGQLAQKVANLQTAAMSIENTNLALQGRTTQAQAKILRFEDPAITQARKYIDGLVTVMKIKLSSQVTSAAAVQLTLTQAEQTLTTQASTPVTQVEYDAQNANFEASKTNLINQMSALQTVYSDLMTQATALNDQANKVTINSANIALKVAKEDIASLHLTISNVPPPVPGDADADGVTDASDNCPNIANADQANMDQDATGDLCDADKDGDGIANDTDNCPVNANADQANTDGDSLGNVCDQDNNQESISQYQTRFNDLNDRFNSFEDDYDEYERKYTRAEQRDDAAEIRKYKAKLNDLQEDVQDLGDDLDDLLNDVEDNTNDRDLEDDVNNLIDDVQQLDENIDDTLGTNQNTNPRTNFIESTPRPQTPTATQTNEIQEVEVQTFSGLPVIQNDQTSTVSSWDNMRVYAWLGVGALLIVAVLVLFIAAIIRK